MKLFLEIILGLAFAQSGFAQTLPPTQPPPTSPPTSAPTSSSSTPISPPTCGTMYSPIEYSGSSGTIYSPGWPGDYPPNSTCYWFINCGGTPPPQYPRMDGQGEGPLPKISVHWGGVSMPIYWAEDAGCGDGIPKGFGIFEPACQSMEARLEDLTRGRSADYPGQMYVTSNGYVAFYGWLYGTGGTGFEIKYECPEPCKDEKSSKACKKLKKKGKCSKKGVWKKCMKTCEKCDKTYYP